MAIRNENETCIFETEGAWSFGHQQKLDLNTGSWRTARPVIISKECTRCGVCYVYCPIQCIQIDDAWENFVPNLHYCKGCGVCAKECRQDAIQMTPEGEFANERTNE